MAKKAKVAKAITPFWQELVGVYFAFCREKFDEVPSFDGSAPRDLKAILKSLQERAEKSGIEWTLDVAKKRLFTFLEFSFQDQWLSKNWLLSNLNRQKDKIFFNIRKAVSLHPINPFD